MYLYKHIADISNNVPNFIIENSAYGKEFVIAGGFVHDLVHKLIPKDIDIFVFNISGYCKLLEIIKKIYPNSDYIIKPTYIQIKHKDLKHDLQLINAFPSIKPTTNHIYSDPFINNKIAILKNKINVKDSPLKFVFKFDLSYVKCLYFNNTVYYTKECQRSWDTKLLDFFYIKETNCDRIRKAFRKEYCVTRKFAFNAGESKYQIPQKLQNLNKYLKNEYWNEPVKLSEKLLNSYPDKITETFHYETKNINQVVKLLFAMVQHNSMNFNTGNYEVKLNESTLKLFTNDSYTKYIEINKENENEEDEDDVEDKEEAEEAEEDVDEEDEEEEDGEDVEEEDEEEEVEEDVEEEDEEEEDEEDVDEEDVEEDGEDVDEEEEVEEDVDEEDVEEDGEDVEEDGEDVEEDGEDVEEDVDRKLKKKIIEESHTNFNFLDKNYSLYSSSIRFNKNYCFKLDDDSFLVFSKLSNELCLLASLTFDKLFNLKPKEKSKVIVYDKEINVQRYYMSYLNVPKYDENARRSYMYTDKSLNFAKELPTKFLPFFNYINKNKKGKKYNQVVINWYDVTDSIDYHSDCQVGLDKSEPITILTFLKNNFNKKKKTNRTKNDPWKILFVPKITSIKNKYIKLDFETKNGMILSMHGKTQERFLHGIPPPEYPHKQRRISMTFRVCN